jgi:hypothetical protein
MIVYLYWALFLLLLFLVVAVLVQLPYKQAIDAHALFVAVVVLLLLLLLF